MMIGSPVGTTVWVDASEGEWLRIFFDEFREEQETKNKMRVE